MKNIKLFEEFNKDNQFALGDVDESEKGKEVEYIDDIDSYRKGKEVKKEGTIINKFIDKNGKVTYNIIDDESGRKQLGIPESMVFFKEQ